MPFPDPLGDHPVTTWDRLFMASAVLVVGTVSGMIGLRVIHLVLE